MKVKDPAIFNASAGQAFLPAGQISNVQFHQDDQREKGLHEIFSLLWQRKLLFSSFFLALLAISCILIALLSSTYTSSALLVLDPREAHYADLPQVVTTISQTSELSLNLVRSEMQVLDSEELARRVVIALQLEYDPTFMKVPAIASLLNILLPWNAKEANTEESKLEAATGRYKKNLRLFNDGKSFVISASFTATTPQLAQRVLAKHVELYMADQRAFKQKAIARAQQWLSPELAQLKAKLRGSEVELENYRNEHHLIRTGGETIVGQQLNGLTKQLAEARGNLAQKIARQNELRSGQADTQQLNSQTLSRLREQEATAAQQAADIRSRFGENSPYAAVTSARLVDVRQKITAELDRMQVAAALDVVITRVALTGLEKNVLELEQEVSKASNAELFASGLEREIDAERKLYDDLLGRSMQVAAQYEIQDADARVVSAPLTPQQPSFPQRGLLGAIAACADILLAGGVVFVIERLRGESRSLREIEQVIGIPGLASIPRLRAANKIPWPPVLEPLTQSAAAVQALINSISFQVEGSSPQLIAVTSALPGDGKTTVAALVAISLAQGGTRVLLIDADMRRCGLSQRMGLSAKIGFVGLLEKGGHLADAVVHNSRTGIDVLAAERSCANPYRLLRAASLAVLLAEARAAYDTVVIDTPPLAAVDDALPFAAAADATILVASYGSTSSSVLRGSFQRLRLAGARNIGVALNRVPHGGQGSQPGLESIPAIPRMYFGANT